MCLLATIDMVDEPPPPRGQGPRGTTELLGPRDQRVIFTILLLYEVQTVR